ncbi:3-hydroxyacyl-CoA dehydrogenase family protein [Vibrio sp. 10N.261.51.F11]|uniref:3-hydroxyacyl-CoA dehydrogenase family protein n=1 Tax=Vibrio sp. 10N.261.51.F11 TaxID=3229678 RepID=UPI00354B9FFA
MKITVIGNGVMGAGIVETILNNEFANEVTTLNWLARDVDKLNARFKFLSRKLTKTERKLGIEKFNSKVVLSKITLSDSFDTIIGSEIVIEAVSEDMNVKKEIIKKVSPYIDQNAILATNTSSYSITELAAQTNFPEQFVGLHFFNPAPIMNLVEIVRGLTTSEDVIRQAESLSLRINKHPVIVNEAPGFIVNRMLIPMINEAISIYAEGIADLEEIDTAMKLGANHPIGPFALSDLIGNDVVLSILSTLYTETGDSKYRPHTLLKKYVRARRLGRKTKQGFYSY